MDSRKFLNSGLSTLVESAISETGSRSSFKFTRRYFGEDLFIKKQIFCYDYLDGPERLTETELPPKSAFFNSLENSEPSDSDYRHAKEVWSSMGMQTMRDYLEVYVKSDVLLLADVLNLFRQTMISDFKLDPLQYYSLMHTCIESAIRGGMAMIGSPRYAQANNPSMPPNEYDPTEPTSFIIFFYFNGLYTSVMHSQRLPTQGFRWLSEYEIDCFDPMDIMFDSDHGYIVDCDLEYPAYLHDSVHDKMSLAPERTKIRARDLSPYSTRLAEEYGISLETVHETEKLCFTLRDKTRYVTSYLNLQMYIKHGLVPKKIHRVLKYTQSAWLPDFMTFVADKRKNAKSKLYTLMYKAIPNSVYGKYSLRM